MIDKGEDGKRERTGQEEIGGWVETEKGEEDGEKEGRRMEENDAVEEPSS